MTRLSVAGGDAIEGFGQDPVWVQADSAEPAMAAE